MANDSDEPKRTTEIALPINNSVSATQNDNRVEGNLAGRDVNQTIHNGNVIFAYPSIPQAPNPFRKLYLRLENEAAESKVLTTYIMQLEIYTRRVENEDVIGLEEKLKLAGRDHQITIGMALKENVYSDLKSNIFSPAYQLIVATLMSKIHERFESQIRPRIKDGISNGEIDRLFSEIVTVPISNELDECPQFDSVAMDYVRGMVYFLTGNCHIRWD
ncbi:ABC-three component system protein [Paracoccus sediminilitoris]|uniref:ABC-three component system protein n=1 Tax=Paracoccus sediminilitoris TaxID=2202419 RepID=UPI0011B935A9|nr:ABC-three component system protein [Paracoccus sediminilitoris]